jgi:hypothetical protein
VLTASCLANARQRARLQALALFASGCYQYSFQAAFFFFPRNSNASGPKTARGTHSTIHNLSDRTLQGAAFGATLAALLVMDCSTTTAGPVLCAWQHADIKPLGGSRTTVCE